MGTFAVLIAMLPGADRRQLLENVVRGENKLTFVQSAATGDGLSRYASWHSECRDRTAREAGVTTGPATFTGNRF